MVKQTRRVDFGKRSGLKVYPVSIGAMRLPEDDSEAVSLIRQAIDAGMVYIDTSRGYGDSEIKVGKALKDGYREKVYLSTKCSAWIKKVEPSDDTSADCTYRRIIESMERLDTGYLDFYQVWNINSVENYALVTAKGGMIDGIRRAMKEGLVRHTGFTTHDKPENISRYIDESDWCEAILFSYNMFNRTYRDVIAKAHEKGIATIVMNPIMGGLFAQDCKPIVEVVRSTVGIDDPVEAGHRYLSGDKNVDTIICGISKPSDISSTIANYQKPPLTAGQRETIDAKFVRLSAESTGFCTNCGYCQPCPANILIPQLMQAAYYSKILIADKDAMQMYNWHTNPDNPEHSADPAECLECGKCEQKCTQRIKIIDMLKYLKQRYGQRE